MYRVLLRNYVTGRMLWVHNCGSANKMEENAIVFWKGPDDEIKCKYKVVKFKKQKTKDYIEGLAKHRRILNLVDYTLEFFANGKHGNKGLKKMLDNIKRDKGLLT